MSDHSVYSISAVIPAYNEATRIATVLHELVDFVDEVIVVDDGSSDSTSEVAAAAGAHVIKHPENRGYIAAIKRGFAAANGEIVVTIDADGELPAEAIPLLVQPILAGDADMVQGARCTVPRKSERLLTWLANRIAPVGDSGTGLRALRTDLAVTLSIRGRCICGIMALEAISLGARIQNVTIRPRRIDKTRGIAWFHLPQFFHIMRWFWRARRGSRSRMGARLPENLWAGNPKKE